MNLELIVAVSFLIAVILQSILLLKEFFSGAKKFSIILFSYITSSFVYLAALLIFISTFYNQSKIDMLIIDNLTSLSPGQIAIWIIIITNSVTLLTIIISIIKKINNGKDSSAKYINQDQVTRLD